MPLEKENEVGGLRYGLSRVEGCKWGVELNLWSNKERT